MKGFGMPARGPRRLFGIAVVGLTLLTPLPAAADDPRPAESPPQDRLRAEIAEAEKGGDWEKAFAARGRLYLADRSAPQAREQLFAALRRVQQVRRHRDPTFRQFARSLSVSDAL